MTPAEVAGRIEAFATAITAELETMPEELAAWHPEPGEWCVKEVLAHLLQTERVGFSGRIAEILADDEPLLRATGREEPACARDLATMLDEFRDQRARSVAQVRALQAADTGRAGIHEKVGRLTVNDLLHEWVHHDRTHQKQILSNIQSYVWPSMGAAQGFGRTVGVRAERLAAELVTANEELAGYLEGLTAEQWLAPTRADDDELRPVGVVALHVAEAHLGINARVMALASGGEVPPRRPESFAERNARHAAENPRPDQAATIGLLRRNAGLVASRVRQLSDEELDRPGFVTGEPTTAEGEFSRRQLTHVRSHLESIRGT